jgi:hypothetical protein
MIMRRRDHDDSMIDHNKCFNREFCSIFLQPSAPGRRAVTESGTVRVATVSEFGPSLSLSDINLLSLAGT